MALFFSLGTGAAASQWQSVNSQTGFGVPSKGQGARDKERHVSRPGFIIRPFTRSAVSSLSGLRDLIADAEVREGYDAVQLGARIKPPSRPTQMRMGDVLAWIDATPGQPHAIGRYQFIPKTFRRLMRDLSIPASERFNAVTQDRMADALIIEAGYREFRSGQLPAAQFMDRLARVWAGLPLASGKSAYHGYAGNRATLSRPAYERRFRALFPEAK